MNALDLENEWLYLCLPGFSDGISVFFRRPFASWMVWRLTDKPVDIPPVPFSFCPLSDCFTLPAAEGMRGRGQFGGVKRAGGGGMQGGGGGGGGGIVGWDGTDDSGSWFFTRSELPASTESLLSFLPAVSRSLVDFKLVRLPRSCFRLWVWRLGGLIVEGVAYFCNTESSTCCKSKQPFKE